MQLLRYIFLAMFSYGVLVGIYGGALLALGMWAFLCYAEGVLSAADKAHDADPRNASVAEPATSDAAAEQLCEYTRTKF